MLHLDGGQDLGDLTLDGVVVVVGQVFDQLLCQGGAAVLVFVEMQHQVRHGGDGALPVDTVVLVKALVLDGDHGVLQIDRNVFQADKLTLNAVQPLVFHKFAGIAVLHHDDRGLTLVDDINVRDGAFVERGGDINRQYTGDDTAGDDQNQAKRQQGFGKNAQAAAHTLFFGLRRCFRRRRLAGTAILFRFGRLFLNSHGASSFITGIGRRGRRTTQLHT